MDKDHIALEEYQIKHFGFSPSSFLAEFQDAVNYSIKYIHEEMKGYIERYLKLSDDQKQVLRVEIEILTKRYAQEVQKCVNKYEDEIKEYFYIPPNVLLEEDKIHEEYADVDLEQLQAEIQNLEREYLKEKSLSFLYENEINHIDQTAKLQEQVSKLLEHIDKTSNSDESTIILFDELKKLYKDLEEKFENAYEINVKMTNQ